MVKRYDICWTRQLGEHMGEVNGGVFVHHEDYAALEAKAYKAGTAAGELQMRVNQLEAELKHMTKSRDEWRDLAQRK